MQTSIIDYLEETEAKFSNKVAFADVKEEISFLKLKNDAQKVGSFIAEYVSKQNPIVVYMDKRAYNICAFMGVVYAGCFYVPIDSQMPLERIRLIFDTLKPVMIIYDDVTSKKIEEINNGIQSILYSDMLNTDINKSVLDEIHSNSKTTDLLYVLFTSGSTGVPKGVTISHLAAIDFMEWICEKYNLDQNITMCNQAPFYFDASVPDIMIPLKTGATVYIPPKSYYTFPKKVLQYLKEKEVNTIVWVPSALCNVVNCRALEVCVPDRLKLVIFCGEVMPCKHLNVWRKNVPDALYVNMYGPTEATYACTYYNINKCFTDDEKLPLGRACENSEIILLNDKNEIAKTGEIGELCILGQCLSFGYYNNQERTRAAFVQNPINTFWNEIIYRTGDLAYKDEDGVLWFSGRKDFQIKRLGHRIELGEIESAMLSTPGIDNGCCLFNEENSDIIAVYVGTISQEDLASSLQEKVPHYMIPNKYIVLKTMPMNLNGKIDRIKLKRDYVEG